MASFSRFSLKSLAELKKSPESSRRLLESVVERLHCQLSNDLLLSSSSSCNNVINKSVQALVYLHRDTCRLAEQLLMSRRLWERYSEADQHTIHSTFMEISARHGQTIETVIQIVENRIHNNSSIIIVDPDLHSCHDDKNNNKTNNSAERFLQQRLGIQLLCHHHGELVKDRGAICQDWSINDIVEEAIVESKHIVEAHLLVCPAVHVSGSVRATFVRTWLQHSLVELLKNAMAAVVRQHHHHKSCDGSAGESTTSSIDLLLPAIELNLHRNETTTIISMVDSGTGIRDEQQVFRLGHTSHGKHWDRLDEQQSYAAVRSPLSSLGVGLSVARYQTEHFGGTLTLQNNIERNGCTARMELPHNDTLLERIPGQ